MARLVAGTSGFAYPSWKPGFYPEKLPAARFLEHYAGRLTSVEVNYTFRRMPSASLLEGWAGRTPPGFVFALKANQRITHWLRLENAEEATATFLRAVEPLYRAGKLGPVLLQLPPQFGLDVGRLAVYLSLLPATHRFAVEFRHPSWFGDDVYELLSGHGVALCVAEAERLTVPDVVTAGFVYYRFRKPEYRAEEVAALAERVRGHLAAGRDVYAYFKHEDDPAGALAAERLLALAA